jgi:hypothetical protein
MVRIMRRTFIPVAIAAVAFAFAGAPAGAQQPIGSHQHFAGRVNGTRNLAVVYTVCPGPAGPGRTGSIAGGQRFSVVRASGGRGYTGLFTQIYAWFVPRDAVTTTAPVQVKFTSYDAPQMIPTSVAVPCDGFGLVEFSSCPYLAPCAYGWVPDYVLVKFVNIAL